MLIGVSTKAAPLSAIVMNEGNPHDQAHDTGYIDWIRSAQYIVVAHRKVAHFVHQVVQSGSHSLEMAKQPAVRLTAIELLDGKWRFLDNIIFW